MFQEIFCHPQERKTVFYSLLYNAPKLMPAGGLERGGTDYLSVPPLSWSLAGKNLGALYHKL
jgi:hypothetical protein